MVGFKIIGMKLKEMYQMITFDGDAELELKDSLDPFSEVGSHPHSARDSVSPAPNPIISHPIASNCLKPVFTPHTRPTPP